MARFKAYSSGSDDDDEDQAPEPVKRAPYAPPADDDDSDEEEEDESEESSSTSGSNSDMDEDELRTSKQSQAAEDDEDDEDEDMEEQEIQQALSPPPVDRTLISRAQAIGMDAQRMHVMQTSLFRVPEESAALKAIHRPAVPRPTVKLLNRKHSRDSDGDGFRTEPKEVRRLIFQSNALLNVLLATSARPSPTT